MDRLTARATLDARFDQIQESGQAFSVLLALQGIDPLAAASVARSLSSECYALAEAYETYRLDVDDGGESHAAD